MNARNLGDALVKDIAGKRALLWIDGNPSMIQQAAAVFSNQDGHGAEGTYPFMEKDYPTVRDVGVAPRRQRTSRTRSSTST